MVEATDSRPIVTVTGITGFLGSHVGLQLLQAGEFKVRGTVRSTTAANKIDPIRNSFGELFNQVELVEANLLNAESMARAIQGSTYVIHVASPFMFSEPKDPQEQIKPAVEGTKAVLEACKAAGVQRLCITSSTVAIYEQEAAVAPDVFTEKDWTDVNKKGVGSYELSKTLAERAAWEFWEKEPEATRFGLSTVNPGAIFGPSLIGGGFTSGKVIEMFMNNAFPGGCPKIMMPGVDVRNVADAHIRAIKSDQAQGKRHILCEGAYWFTELGQMLSTHFKPLGYKIPTKEAAYCLVKMFACCSKEAAKIATYWGVARTFDNTRSKQELGIEYIPMSDSLRDMGLNMIETGVVPDKRPADAKGGNESSAVIMQK